MRLAPFDNPSVSMPLNAAAASMNHSGPACCSLVGADGGNPAPIQRGAAAEPVHADPAA